MIKERKRVVSHSELILPITNVTRVHVVGFNDYIIRVHYEVVFSYYCSKAEPISRVVTHDDSKVKSDKVDF